MSNKLIAMTGLFLLVLSGCSQPEHLNSDFGNAVRQNMAAQVVNPTPRAATAAPEMDGRRAVIARDRYLAVPPETLVPERTSKQSTAK